MPIRSFRLERTILKSRVETLIPL